MQSREHVVELYDRHSDALYRLCYFYTGNGPDAADAMQNTLVKLMEYEGEFDSAYHEKCWLMKVAANECRDILKHWWRRTVPYETLGEFEAQKQVYAEDSILSEVMKLPAKYRVVLYMHYYEGYSLVELSRLMKTNESTLRSRLMRGRKMLRISLEDNPR